MTIFNYLSLCSSDPCSSPEGQPHERRKKPSFLARKTKCSWRKKKKKTKKEKRHHHQEPILADSSISMDLALEEWFAKSPCVENKNRICNNNNNEDGVSYSVSLEALLNSSEFNASSMETSDSRDLSLSLEKLLMKRENVVEVGLYSLAKTKSMSIRERKVSFRLPEASDIIILNSPERS